MPRTTSRLIYATYGAFEASFTRTQSLAGIDYLVLNEVHEKSFDVPDTRARRWRWRQQWRNVKMR